MVLIAGGFGDGLSKRQRKELRAERRRLDAQHRKRAGKKNTATLSNPSYPRKKRKGGGRKINGRDRNHPDRTQARKMRRASVCPRGTVPGWAMRLSVAFVRWNHDAHIKFRAPDRDMKESSWQVSLIIPGGWWGRKEWIEILRKLKGFEWVISHHKDGLDITVWKVARRR